MLRPHWPQLAANTKASSSFVFIDLDHSVDHSVDHSDDHSGDHSVGHWTLIRRMSERTIDPTGSIDNGNAYKALLEMI